MSNIVGSLRVLLGLNTAEFEGDLGKAQRAAAAALKGIAREGRQLEALGTAGKNVGTALTVGLTAPILAFGAAATKSSLEMSKGMGAVATLIPGATARVAELKNGVQEMALSSTRSTTDLTNGLYEVISAWGDSADTLSLLDVNARAATAGMATTLEAIKLTAGVTKAYGDTSANAVRQVSDLALLTANLGQTTFPELAASIGRVTPVAKTLGVSQQELFAGFATLTGPLGNTAEVSTQLAAVLMGMISPTEEMSAAIHQLGYSGAQAMVSQLGLVGSLKALAGTTDGSAEALNKLFGRAEALNAVFGLTGAQASAFEKNLKAMWAAAGATDQAYKAQASTDALGQALARLRNAWDVGLQRSGDALGPTLLRFADAAAPLVRLLGDLAGRFSHLPQPVQTTVIALLGIAAAKGPVTFALSSVIGNIGTAIRVLSDLGRMAGLAGRGGVTLATTTRTVTNAVGALGNTVPVLTARLWLMEVGFVGAGKAAALLLAKVALVAGVGVAAYALTDLLLKVTGLREGCDKLAERWTLMLMGFKSQDLEEAARGKNPMEAWTQQQFKAFLELQKRTREIKEKAAREGRDVDAAGGRLQKLPPKPTDDEVKSLTAVRAELTQLQAAQRSTYEGAVAQIRSAIAARLQEAKGVAAITAAVFALQAAQIQAAHTDLIRTNLGSVAGDAQKQAAEVERALVAAAMRATGATEEAISKALLSGARLTQELLDSGVAGGGITTEQLTTAADGLSTVRARGAELTPVLAGIAGEWRNAASGVDVFEEEARKAVETSALLGPTVGQVIDEFDRWRQSAGERGGIEGLSTEQLQKYVEKLRELQAHSRELGAAMPADKAEALAAELGAAWRRLQDLSGGPEILNRNGVAIGAATVVTQTWSERLRDLTAVFELLGIRADSTLGRVLGGLNTGAAAVAKLKQAATAGGKKGFDLGNLFKAEDGKVTASSLVGGITSSLQAVSSAISVGKAIVGLFRGDPVKKAARQAGNFLGTEVSRELAEKMRATQKELGVSLQTAALLHLSDAMGAALDRGESAGKFTGQVQQLLDIAQKGGKEARKALEEAGKGFTAIADEAVKAGVVGDRSLRAIIAQARNAGQVVPEIKDFVRGQLQSAVTGIAQVVGKFEDEKLTGGLDVWLGAGANWREMEARAAENAEALGRRFSATFFAAVGEFGIVEAGKQLGEPFERLREQFTTVFPAEKVDELLGPVQRLIDLSNNPMFAGGAEAAAGLKANLEGLANADLLQATDLVDYGTLARATVDQMLAGGASAQEAFRAAQPLLQSLLSASEQYNTQLDAGTQSLIDQARENGVAFRTDPQQRMVEVLEAIAVKMGALPEVMSRAASSSAQSFGTIDVAGSTAAAKIGTAFGTVGPSVTASLAQMAVDAEKSIAPIGVVATDAAAEAVAAFGDLAERSTSSWETVGGAATATLDGIWWRLEALGKGVVVPIRLDAGGGVSLPKIEWPEMPEIPRAAKGLYGRKGPTAGYPIIIGDGSGDELVAPVEGALRLAYRVAREGGGGAGVSDMAAVVAELRAVRADNARLAAALERAADRPVRLHAPDGRVLADVVADEWGARGHAGLERASRRASEGRRGGNP